MKKHFPAQRTSPVRHFVLGYSAGAFVLLAVFGTISDASTFTSFPSRVLIVYLVPVRIATRPSSARPSLTANEVGLTVEDRIIVRFPIDRHELRSLAILADLLA